MPTVMLSEHFSLAEMTYSQTASRMGLDNTPTVDAYVYLQRLADTMEKVRALCGSSPVTISSGYRSPEVNAAVGGSSTSAHMSGLAADFIIPLYGTPLEVCNHLMSHVHSLAIDQLILEYSDWVHLGLCVGVPRYQCLTISNGGTTEGFV